MQGCARTQGCACRHGWPDPLQCALIIHVEQIDHSCTLPALLMTAIYTHLQKKDRMLLLLHNHTSSWRSFALRSPAAAFISTRSDMLAAAAARSAALCSAGSASLSLAACKHGHMQQSASTVVHLCCCLQRWLHIPQPGSLQTRTHAAERQQWCICALLSAAKGSASFSLAACKRGHVTNNDVSTVVHVCSLEQRWFRIPQPGSLQTQTHAAKRQQWCICAAVCSNGSASLSLTACKHGHMQQSVNSGASMLPYAAMALHLSAWLPANTYM
jgi:hypothetical protein